MITLERKCRIVNAVLDQSATKQYLAKVYNVHPSTIKRWCDKFLKDGKAGLIHKSTNKVSNRKKDISVVLDYIKDNNLYECNFSLLSELLESKKGFSITGSCIRTNLFKLGMLSPLATKRVRKKMKKKLKEEAKNKTLSLAATETLTSLEAEYQTSVWVHPSKSRSKYMGERLEMDACEIDNLLGDGKKYTIHVCVDDATGSILGLYIDEQETLNGYFHTLNISNFSFFTKLILKIINFVKLNSIHSNFLLNLDYFTYI